MSRDTKRAYLFTTLLILSLLASMDDSMEWSILFISYSAIGSMYYWYKCYQSTHRIQREHSEDHAYPAGNDMPLYWDTIELDMPEEAVFNLLGHPTGLAKLDNDTVILKYINTGKSTSDKNKLYVCIRGGRVAGIDLP